MWQWEEGRGRTWKGRDWGTWTGWVWAGQACLSYVSCGDSGMASCLWPQPLCGFFTSSACGSSCLSSYASMHGMAGWHVCGGACLSVNLLNHLFSSVSAAGWHVMPPSLISISLTAYHLQTFLMCMCLSMCVSCAYSYSHSSFVKSLLCFWKPVSLPIQLWAVACVTTLAASFMWQQQLLLPHAHFFVITLCYSSICMKSLNRKSMAATLSSPCCSHVCAIGRRGTGKDRDGWGRVWDGLGSELEDRIMDW